VTFHDYTAYEREVLHLLASIRWACWLMATAVAGGAVPFVILALLATDPLQSGESPAILFSNYFQLLPVLSQPAVPSALLADVGAARNYARQALSAAMAGGSDMVARTNPLGRFTVSFFRDGDLLEDRVAPNPERVLKVAIMLLAELDALQDGDRLVVKEA
jgi:hypothetical protein